MSKIGVHYSLIVAKKVVRELEKILPEKIANDCLLESWSNGREQGLCIEYAPTFNGTNISNWKSVVIAQQRNRDDILIVHGLYKDFDTQTNQPNDEVWKDRVHFQYDGAKLAAKYIANVLKTT